MWGWIKKAVVVTAVVAVIAAVVASTGLVVALGATTTTVGLLALGASCAAMGLVTGAVVGAALEGGRAIYNGKSVMTAVCNGAMEGALIGAYTGVACGFGACAAVSGGVGGVVTLAGLTLSGGASAAAVGVAAATAASGILVGGIAAAVHEYASSQTSSQNQNNTNQKQDTAIESEHNSVTGQHANESDMLGMDQNESSASTTTRELLEQLQQPTDQALMEQLEPLTELKDVGQQIELEKQKHAELKREIQDIKQQCSNLAAKNLTAQQFQSKNSFVDRSIFIAASMFGKNTKSSFNMSENPEVVRSKFVSTHHNF